MPRYYDYQARLEWSPAAKHTLSLFGFGTDDRVELASTSVNTEDPAAANRFQNRTRFTRGIATWRYEDETFDNRLAVTALDSLFHFEVGESQYVSIGQISATVRDEAKLAISRALELSVGTEIELRRTEVKIRAPRAPREGDPRDPSFTLDPTITADETPANALIAGWASLELSPVDWLSVTPGLRLDVWTRKVPDETVLQPRIQASVELDEFTAIRGAAGYYARPPVNDENLQDDLESERAIQTTLGLERTVFEGVELQLTGFFTERSNLVTYANGRAGTGDVEAGYTNDGQGRTFGGELLLRARFQDFFGWIAYTLSRSTRVDGEGQAERLFDFDQTHNLVAVASYAFGSAFEWRVGARFQLTSGRPYTPVTSSVLVSDLNVYEPVFGATNSRRYGFQHQLDLRLDRSFQFGDFKFSTYLDVSNVYLNAAVLAYDYNWDYTQIEEFTNLPILPSIGLRGEF